nr:Chain C, PKSFLV PEPTIDE [Homo sapiens]
PKSFLV